METKEPKRELTHDEKKAMEAAFRGASFNPAWSEAARVVYDGVTAAMNKKSSPSTPVDVSEEKPALSSPTDKASSPAP